MGCSDWFNIVCLFRAWILHNEKLKRHQLMRTCLGHHERATLRVLALAEITIWIRKFVRSNIVSPGKSFGIENSLKIYFIHISEKKDVNPLTNFTLCDVLTTVHLYEYGGQKLSRRWWIQNKLYTFVPRPNDIPGSKSFAELACYRGQVSTFTKLLQVSNWSRTMDARSCCKVDVWGT